MTSNFLLSEARQPRELGRLRAIAQTNCLASGQAPRLILRCKPIVFLFWFRLVPNATPMGRVSFCPGWGDSRQRTPPVAFWVHHRSKPMS